MFYFQFKKYGHFFELFNTLNIRALQTKLFWAGVWWYDPTQHHTNTTVHIHSHKMILACTLNTREIK